MENWLIKKRNILKKNLLKYDLDDIFLDILSRRELNKIEEIDNYLNVSKNQENNPFLLKDMSEAVDFILDNIKKGKKILISLDYDVDGIISGAIASKGLKKIGANVECIFPDRVVDGYGINERIVNYAYDNKFEFIITFDNGIAAFEAINLAREKGINVIVTDHHEVPKTKKNKKIVDDIVNANFVINPHREDCFYPFPKICGAMVAYKLILALHMKLGLDIKNIEEEYSLVCIATICDVMELSYENRVFVKYGLELLKNTKNVGLKKLFDILNISDLSVYDIGFKIGPCFNSSGRLSTANTALKLLIEEDENLCFKIANELVELNNIRKEMTINATNKAIRIIDEQKLYLNNIIILYLDDIHESLAGIIAGRIKEKYNIPTIIYTDSNDFIKGSARSTDAINIYDVLVSFKDYFLKFGGHSAAAGMSISKEVFEEFSLELLSYMNDLIFSREKSYLVDAIIPFEKINIDFAKKLDIFAPFGKGNPEIILSTLGVGIKSLVLNEKNSNILKVYLNNGFDSKWFTTFNAQEILNKIKNKLNLKEDYDIINQLPKDLFQEKFDIIYKLSVNRYNGNEYLNIDLLTIR